MMVGSLGMVKCPGSEAVVGLTHNKCHCLGVRRIPNTMPLSLLHVLNKDGQVSEDVSKLATLDVIKRTSLRTNRPLTQSYVEPPSMPAVPFKITNSKVVSIDTRFKTEKGDRSSRTCIEVTDPTVLDTLKNIIQRHSEKYKELRVRLALWC